MRRSEADKAKFLLGAVADLHRHQFQLCSALLAVKARKAGRPDLPISWHLLTDEQGPAVIANESLLIAASLRRAGDAFLANESAELGCVGFIHPIKLPPLELSFREATNKIVHATSIEFVEDLESELEAAKVDSGANDFDLLEQWVQEHSTELGSAEEISIAKTMEIAESAVTKQFKHRKKDYLKFRFGEDLKSFGNGLGGLKLECGHKDGKREWIAVVHMGAFMHYASILIEQLTSD
ncbi:MAG: hypothetical protein H6R19_885 [Proteobacteria bacterium]|nr:hypothetical protein [Pseudomonadota bacterium]